MKRKTLLDLLIPLGMAGLFLLVGCARQESTLATVAPTSTATTLPPTPTPSPIPAPQAILDDLRVRQAIAHCIDRNALIRAAYPWLEDTKPFEMDSFLPSNHPFYAGNDPEFQRYPYDPEKGRALLESAEWTLPVGAEVRVNADWKELHLTLTAHEISHYKSWIPVVVEQMKNCGFRVETDYYHSFAFGWPSPIESENFEMGAFPWYIMNNLASLHDRFACDSIPSKGGSDDFGIEGQPFIHNYAGWCNSGTDQAMEQAEYALGFDMIRDTFRTVQIESSRDVPGLALFQRVMVYATRNDLQNFRPQPIESVLWNISQWEVPDRDVIVIGMDDRNPDEWPYEVVNIVDSPDSVRVEFDYQPVTLKEFPTLENGGAIYKDLPVNAGDMVYNKHGDVVELKLGVRVFDSNGIDTLFVGKPIVMTHLVVTYQFVEGLKWSDGVPVSRADYQLYYDHLCDPENYDWWDNPCEEYASVEFLSDTAYAITYIPGYHDLEYFLPPLGRTPVHRQNLLTSIGIGPYELQRWDRGKQMIFTANPHYFGGPVATPKIIIRFLPREDLINALINHEIDVVMDWRISNLHDESFEKLLQAQSAGKIHLYFVPNSVYEQLDFRLTVQ